MTKQGVIYTRVSSAEQLREGFSVAAQTRILREYAERNGIEIVAEFSDDETAKATGRTDFTRMVSFLKAHSDHAILVEKVDRLYRNIRDYLTLDELGAEVHFVKEGGKDRRDSDARFMHLIRVGMARKYVENLSEEVKKGMAQKCREGGWPTWAPLGYINVKDPGEKKRTGGIVPDPVKASLVLELFEAAATGAYSLGDLAQLARKTGLRGRYGAVLSKSALHYVLTNPAYTGRFSWSGITYQGRYQPMVSAQLWDEVQAALAGRTRTKARKHTFAFAGLVRCAACGTLLTGERQKGRYVYYSCRGAANCRRFYPERRFDEETVRILQSLRVDGALSQWIASEMARWYDASLAKESEGVQRMQRRVTELRNLEVTAYEEKLLGRMPEEIWKAMTEKWRVERGEIEAAIAVAHPVISRDEVLRAVRSPFELVEVAADQYLNRSAAEKSRLLKILCSNFSVSDVSLSVTLRSPFDLMAVRGDRSEWLTRLDDFRTAILCSLKAA
ncbi:MAG: recombinase family protein [Candidatus Magasanikiibacteriota bacterium]